MRAHHHLTVALAGLAMIGSACATSGTEPTSTTGPIDTTTSTLPATRQDSIIIHGLVVGDGEPAIGLLDPDTGTITELVDAPSLAEGAGHLFLDASANLLYLSRSATSCTSEILTVDVSTGQRRVVATGAVPVVSPDGRFLAFSHDPACRAHDDIHVRDLTDGTERVWTSELDDKSELPAVVIDLSWSPNGQTLAAELLLEDGTEIRLLDATADGGRVSSATKVSSPNGLSWTSPLFAHDGRLLVAETSHDQPRTFRIMSVNPDGSQAIVLAEAEEPVRLVDVHPTNGQILFTSAASRFDVDLWSLDGATATFIMAGVSDAVWLPDHGAPISQSW